VTTFARVVWYKRRVVRERTTLTFVCVPMSIASGVRRLGIGRKMGDGPLVCIIMAQEVYRFIVYDLGITFV
jgi:hypothetical protein